MTVYRRIVARNFIEMTVVEKLECGHENILYRAVDSKDRVAWRNQRGESTNTSVTSRECSPCETAGLDENKGWTS